MQIMAMQIAMHMRSEAIQDGLDPHPEAKFDVPKAEFALREAEFELQKVKIWAAGRQICWHVLSKGPIVGTCCQRADYMTCHYVS